jgi:protein-L-isoaspartate(D-aspartate) O-methyltransferase
VSGWFIPPPSAPVKSDKELRGEREAKVRELGRRGLLGSERLRRAMLTVRREDFIPPCYRDHAYEEVPLPLPGERATISCPHSYPLFYEPLGLGEGTGSSRLASARATAPPLRGRWWAPRVWS